MHCPQLQLLLSIAFCNIAAHPQQPRVQVQMCRCAAVLWHALTKQFRQIATFTAPGTSILCVCRVCVSQAGRRSSLPSKNIVLVLPGNAYTPDSLEHFSAAAAAADSSLLEIAWAVAAEEPAGTSYSLSQLSQLLFDTEAPLDQYATFSMLLSDKVYFKSSYKVTQADLCARTCSLLCPC